MNTPNFASRNHSGVGRASSDCQLAAYYLPAAGAAAEAVGGRLAGSNKANPRQQGRRRSRLMAE
jgi:hypothetical protein